MINFPVEEITHHLEGFLTLTNEQLKMLNEYGNLLLEWNEKINLTAITEPEEVVIKHFLDCLLFFKNIDVKNGAKVIDVGTGAGFPGIVLKIARPDIELTLLDGLNKRIVFLKDVLDKLGISAKAVHMRAEEGGKNAEYREKYDIACARAVAQLNTLSEYCIPFVKNGGSFIAMKGPSAAEELGAARNAIDRLGGGEPVIFSENLPDGSKRCFVQIKKISQTPPKYPRISAKISKQPL